MAEQEKIRLMIILIIACICIIFLNPTAFQEGKPVCSAPVAIDAQQVKDQDLMTRADYRPIPGQGQVPGGTYGERKRYDFFIHSLLGIEPPDWNKVEAQKKEVSAR